MVFSILGLFYASFFASSTVVALHFSAFAATKLLLGQKPIIVRITGLKNFFRIFEAVMGKV
ncbi:MAG TPA: hypothetical protein VKO20_07795 [Desulfosalsimonadaceae bacterium]|nr:hypothetical protein [Desulfosalsimonadaceae bacterium]